MKGHPFQGAQALGIEMIGATKTFGAFRALDGVSIKVAAGTIHALLGENGAGKSTLVKGLVGYSVLDEGQIIAQHREVRIDSPRAAQALGIGMVYQHFTVAEGLTVEENLLLARGTLPWKLDWVAERAALAAFMRQMPFSLPLDRKVAALAAGEKQKLEILKQLYLRQRFLILDEPTSVLTPHEADEVLGLMRTLTSRGEVTVLMITHKFREVMDYADDVTVLRKGRQVGTSAVASTNPEQLAAWMMGATYAAGPEGAAEATGVLAGIGTKRTARKPLDPQAQTRLHVRNATVIDERGHAVVRELSLAVRAGEILGIAGVSGNGQRELVEALVGQRPLSDGDMAVGGKPYHATRAQMAGQRVYAIPEEPLKNACVAGMSVAENLALREFDRRPLKRAGGLLDRRAIRERALRLIADFNVRPPLPEQQIGTLSGGNVQRAVLARELGQPVDVLIVANPVFGLDFASVADIHARLVAARDAGAAVLLVSEDLDELLALADRIAVMAEGRIVYETTAAGAERAELGRHMAGHGHAAGPVPVSPMIVPELSV
ncbi:ABC transporter ATP-binding protein (plasmid) [Cupriavidus sp. KK10]|jgi:simple sugar transport system ATP-binding protein|uniref:ABC transporter ATP-binding protein n=1 Tax=Cupriavidus sp. KK10 TaxID=1478019 RepID=UPI001BA59988|nr:ABC transporter ATP-binding protein [Cupriavidus sp. KK10]QUN32587.1 ABC transporter ATP-binding protein [Cupriavidus sp. KK10]